MTKAVTMLHNHHHSRTNIEFGGHIGVMKLPSEDPMAKYSLLSMAIAKIFLPSVSSWSLFLKSS